MSTIISVVSFRRGTGRSSLIANLGVWLAKQGYRVGLVDTDFAAPGLPVFFGLADRNMPFTLNDYLWDRCSLEQAILKLPPTPAVKPSGDLFILPASNAGAEILRAVRQTYNLDKLYDAIQQMIQICQLDFILLDTLAGLNRDTLHAMALSNTLVVLLRPDQQDFQGASVLVEVGRDLGISHVLLVLNEAPASLDPTQARQELERTYQCPAAAILPYSVELASLSSGGLVVNQAPECTFVSELGQLAAQFSA